MKKRPQLLRTIILICIVTGVLFLLSSCNTKKSAERNIKDLQQEEVRDDSRDREADESKTFDIQKETADPDKSTDESAAAADNITETAILNDSIVETQDPEDKTDEETVKNRQPQRFYEKLLKGEAVNILIDGDSIGDGAGASDDSKKWESLLKADIEKEYGSPCSITNISMGGNGSYAGYVRGMLLDENEDFDLIILCYGQNDDHSVIACDYEVMLRSLIKRYPGSGFISILESSQKKYTAKIKTIQEIAAHYGTDTADTIAAFNNSGIPYEELTVDKKHPNDRGYELYAETVMDTIRMNTGKIPDYPPSDVQCLCDEVINYNNFRYYDVSEFVKADDQSYILSLSDNTTAIIGIYREQIPGKGTISIITDDIEQRDYTAEWPYDFTQDEIMRLDDNMIDIKGSLTLKFSSNELAGGFKGLILSSP